MGHVRVDDVDLGVVAEKERGAHERASERRLVQRRVALVVGGVDVGALLDRHLEHRQQQRRRLGDSHDEVQRRGVVAARCSSTIERSIGEGDERVVDITRTRTHMSVRERDRPGSLTSNHGAAYLVTSRGLAPLLSSSLQSSRCLLDAAQCRAVQCLASRSLAMPRLARSNDLTVAMSFCSHAAWRRATEREGLTLGAGEDMMGLVRRYDIVARAS